MKWEEEDKQILLDCITEDDLREQFPNHQISSLRRRQREFRVGEHKGNKTLREEEMDKSKKKLFQYNLETTNKGEAQIML